MHDRRTQERSIELLVPSALLPEHRQDILARRQLSVTRLPLFQPPLTLTCLFAAVTFTYQDRAQSNETTIPFPQGLKAIAGNPFRRVLPSNYQQIPAERAVSYKCGGSSIVKLHANNADHLCMHTGSTTSYQLPTSACSGGLSVELVFPSCCASCVPPLKSSLLTISVASQGTASILCIRHLDISPIPLPAQSTAIVPAHTPNVSSR